MGVGTCEGKIFDWYAGVYNDKLSHAKNDSEQNSASHVFLLVAQGNLEIINKNKTHVPTTVIRFYNLIGKLLKIYYQDTLKKKK